MVFAHRHHDLLLFRCDAAMLHSLNSGRATSGLDRIRAQSREEQASKATTAATDWLFLASLFLSCSCRIKRRFPLIRMCALLPPHIQPATDEQGQTKDNRLRPRPAQDMHPLQGAASQASRDRLCRPVAVLPPPLPPSSASHLQSSTCLPECGPG